MKLKNILWGIFFIIVASVLCFLIYDESKTQIACNKNPHADICLSLTEKKCKDFCYPDKYFFDNGGFGSSECECKEDIRIKEIK